MAFIPPTPATRCLPTSSSTRSTQISRRASLPQISRRSLRPAPWCYPELDIRHARSAISATKPWNRCALSWFTENVLASRLQSGKVALKSDSPALLHRQGATEIADIAEDFKLGGRGDATSLKRQ